MSHTISLNNQGEALHRKTNRKRFLVLVITSGENLGDVERKDVLNMSRVILAFQIIHQNIDKSE